MNKNQEYILRKALEQMQIVRHMLDDIMYRTDPLSPEEFKKIRECYDLVCQANDKI